MSLNNNGNAIGEEGAGGRRRWGGWGSRLRGVRRGGVRGGGGAGGAEGEGAAAVVARGGGGREFEEGCATAGEAEAGGGRARRGDARGLGSDGGSKLKMLLTFIDTLPMVDARLMNPSVVVDARSEEGIYYALDLGGTNFRVLRVQLGDERRALGFTFSFPVRQLPFPQAFLSSGQKGFSIEDAVSCKDIARGLEEAMTTKGLNMRVAALVNDTVGTLALVIITIRIQWLL
uniref:Phosphotransferase n=1 Tax=Ananas comosus var. bracteatus TaxID=296719 RepID=A0A6V7QA14_ANACO|nr:unnamed protein product [Ananas comosus var. bracteatus]